MGHKWKIVAWLSGFKTICTKCNLSKEEVMRTQWDTLRCNGDSTTTSDASSSEVEVFG